MDYQPLHRPFRLIVVSNRLPVVIEQDERGTWQEKRGAGGLVTALTPVLREKGGIWIGSPGTIEEDGAPVNEIIAASTRDQPFNLRPVLLTRAERESYYNGFSNEIIWPLFHDLQSRTNIDPAYWRTYHRVNRKFARVIAEIAEDDDFIWVHDYHLVSVAEIIHRLRPYLQTGFFLHIPFPSLDIFSKLPWRNNFLKALLSYDLIGFQSDRDLFNFLRCLQHLLDDITAEKCGDLITIRQGDRAARAGVFPISVDFDEFALQADSDEVSAAYRELKNKYEDKWIILGSDRLDYTKGIIQKLKAFREVLLRFPEMKGKVILVQVVVPSRLNIPEYANLRLQIEQLVGEINGEFTEAGWVPVHYIFRCLSRAELLAYYRIARIALVTPLKDGMNLVAKEYCASNIEEDGVLILSEFAGAAAQLGDYALLVNPYDLWKIAEAIHQAFAMEYSERRSRMHALRKSIRKEDVRWWVNRFLQSIPRATESGSDALPPVLPAPSYPPPFVLL